MKVPTGFEALVPRAPQPPVVEVGGRPRPTLETVVGFAS